MKFLGYAAPAGEERNGTARLEIHGKTGELPAFDYGDHIQLFGIAVKYRTGSKVWNGSAIYWKANGSINNIRGPIDNRQRPGVCMVLGFYADYAAKVRSNHVGN